MAYLHYLFCLFLVITVSFLPSSRAFYNRNKCFPSHIFFYRDGVGVGDIEKVREFELGALKVLNKKKNKMVMEI